MTRSWSKRRTKSQLHRGSESYEIVLALHYESVELTGLRQAVDEKRVLDDL